MAAVVANKVKKVRDRRLSGEPQEQIRLEFGSNGQLKQIGGNKNKNNENRKLHPNAEYYRQVSYGEEEELLQK